MKKKTKESVTVSDFGAAGAPIDRRHPFYFGFVATIGALTAFVLMRALASASQVFVLFWSRSFWQLVLIQLLKRFVAAVYPALAQSQLSSLAFY
jgi:hypothetical protein